MNRASRPEPGPIDLVLLAAGLGSRFGGSKQIEPFGPGGETLLELNVHDAVAAGVRRVVVVTRRPLLDPMEEVLARIPAWIDRRVVLQEEAVGPAASPARDRPWGTAHAVLAASGFAAKDNEGGGPGRGAVIANADDLYGREAFVALLSELGESDPTGFAALAGYRLDRTLTPSGGVSRGVCDVREDGTLRSVREITGLRRTAAGIVGEDSKHRSTTYPDDTVVSMNLWGLGPWWWPRLAVRFRAFLDEAGDSDTAEFRLPDVIGDEAREGAIVRVATTDAHWTGVTHAADRDPVRETLRTFFSEGRYPTPLFSEVGS